MVSTPQKICDRPTELQRSSSCEITRFLQYTCTRTSTHARRTRASTHTRSTRAQHTNTYHNNIDPHTSWVLDETRCVLGSKRLERHIPPLRGGSRLSRDDGSVAEREVGSEYAALPRSFVTLETLVRPHRPQSTSRSAWVPWSGDNEVDTPWGQNSAIITKLMRRQWVPGQVGAFLEQLIFRSARTAQATSVAPKSPFAGAATLSGRCRYPICAMAGRWRYMPRLDLLEGRGAPTARLPGGPGDSWPKVAYGTIDQPRYNLATKSDSIVWVHFGTGL